MTHHCLIGFRRYYAEENRILIFIDGFQESPAAFCSSEGSAYTIIRRRNIAIPKWWSAAPVSIVSTDIERFFDPQLQVWRLQWRY